jgi:hypothetical protein
MYWGMRGSLLACAALAPLMNSAQAQTPVRVVAAPARAVAPGPAATAPPIRFPEVSQPPIAARPAAITSLISLADVGFGSGFRFANLGGRREIFLPLPQSADIAPTELVLTVDDISAHPARRSLEVLVNDRSVSALALDGNSMGRVIRIPLTAAKPRDGFLKLSFLYSGAATQDRCIDVRYVGDSLTIRPDSGVEFEVPSAGNLDIATTAALMPRDVAVVLSARALAPADIAAALTVARSLAVSGRRATFHRGVSALADLAKRGDNRRWSRGIVIVGPADEFIGQLEGPPVTVAGPTSGFATMAAVKMAGFPALLISDASPVRAGRLLGSPSLAATRGVTSASVGEVASPKLPVDRVTFDQLGLALGLVEVFGRAELSAVVNARDLPPARSMTRLVLDTLVAPDDAGEKAVVSVFVNERLLGSTVAASGEPTRLDLALPDGLVGSAANIRTVVQRRSSQGDCRFEPQGYPAQILGSSSLLLTKIDVVRDFADLSSHWANGVEILLPQSAAERPLHFLGLLSTILNTLSPESAPITVKFAAQNSAPAPQASFIAVSHTAPLDSKPLVQFDQGRVAIADRSGRTLLDLGGFNSAAVAQLVTAGGQPGLWIKPFARDGALPNPVELRIDRGDVAVFDDKGTSLAMSTERDTLVKITYPDQVSWATVASRFRPWVIGALWILGTVLFLFALQQIYRRRTRAARE